MTMSYDRTLDGLHRAAERTEQAQNARPRRSGVQRALGNAAESLSRRAVAQREAGVCNAALHTLVDLCYELDNTGQLCNVDPATGKILIPMPTGRSHYQTYGLAFSHMMALRAAMLAWAEDYEKVLPLFYYEESNRRWYLAIADFPRLELALRWLEWRQMTPALWMNGGQP